MGKHLKILSINGGGVRGLLPATILEYISNSTGKQIPELFDFIIGTSIGGILAAAYATPNNITTTARSAVKYSAINVTNILKDNAGNIFPPNEARGYPARLFLSKYPRDNLDNLLKEIFNLDGVDLTLIDTLVPIAVTSQNAVSNEPQIWFSCSKKFSSYFLKDVTGATSAAPTFLPPKYIPSQNQTESQSKNCAQYDLAEYHNQCQYKNLDGGLFANSPTLLTTFLLNQAALNKTTDTCGKYNVFGANNTFMNLSLQFANFADIPKLSIGNDIDITVVSIGTGYFVGPDIQQQNLLGIQAATLYAGAMSAILVATGVTLIALKSCNVQVETYGKIMIASNYILSPVITGLGWDVFDSIKNKNDGGTYLTQAQTDSMVVGIFSTLLLTTHVILGALQAYKYFHQDYDNINTHRVILASTIIATAFTAVTTGIAFKT